jgi:hypothetical protein
MNNESWSETDDTCATIAPHIWVDNPVGARSVRSKANC